MSFGEVVGVTFTTGVGVDEDSLISRHECQLCQYTPISERSETMSMKAQRPVVTESGSWKPAL